MFISGGTTLQIIALSILLEEIFFKDNKVWINAAYSSGCLLGSVDNLNEAIRSSLSKTPRVIFVFPMSAVNNIINSIHVNFLFGGDYTSRFQLDPFP